MRRKLLASIFLITILASMVVPLVGTKKAQALFNNLTDAIPIDNDPNTIASRPNWYTADPAALNIEVTKTAKDGAEFKVKLDFNKDAEKPVDSNANGKFDSADELGVWDKILTKDSLSGNFENTNSNGIFILIGKKLVHSEWKSLLGSYIDKSDRAVSETLLGKLVVPSGQGDVTFTSGTVKYGSGHCLQAGAVLTCTELGRDTTSMRNIGYYFWRANSDVFWQSPLSVSPRIAVSNLEPLGPGEKYYAQVLVAEDNVVPGTAPRGIGKHYAFSNVTEFELDPTAPDIVTISQTGLTQGDQEPPKEANNRPFGDQIYCLKGITDLSLGGCIVIFWYDVVYVATSKLLSLTGQLFDAFANVALDSAIYRAPAANFVIDGWAIVRDISNVFFIFILLYTALGLVLSLHSVDAKKLISKVIIIALLINFSLFFTRVIVDTSNILALSFYNSMKITETGGSSEKVTKNKNEKSISLAVAKGIEPQKIMGDKSIGLLGQRDGITKGNAFLVITLSIILNLVLAYVFFMSAAFFAGRIGVIWISIIFAPFALITSIVPSLGKGAKQLGWEQWLSGFLKACFNAPIFVFFLYLIVRMTNTDVFGGLLSSGAGVTWVGVMIGVFLPAMILIGILMSAKNIAKEMAGEFGTAFTGLVNGAIGLGAMAITGGAAVGMSKVGGVVGRQMQNSERMQRWARGEGRMPFLSKTIGMNAMRLGKKAQTGSFDVRQTGLGNKLSQVTGVNMNTGAGLLKTATLGRAQFSTADTAGGMEGRKFRETKQIKEDAKLFGPNVTAINQINHEEEDLDNLDEQGGMNNQTQPPTQLPRQNPPTQLLDDQGQPVNNAAGQPVMVTIPIPQNMSKNELRDESQRIKTEVEVIQAVPENSRSPEQTARLQQLTRDRNNIDREKSRREESRESLGKARTNAEKAGANTYIASKMDHSGYEVHGRRTDRFGNISKLGHIDFSREIDVEKTRNGWRRFGETLAKSAITGLGTGLIFGGIPGAIVGGTLGVGGAIHGLAGKFVRTSEAQGIDGATHQDDDKHSHAPKDYYKSPATSLFSGLFSTPKNTGSDSHASSDSGGHGH